MYMYEITLAIGPITIQHLCEKDELDVKYVNETLTKVLKDFYKDESNSAVRFSLTISLFEDDSVPWEEYIDEI